MSKVFKMKENRKKAVYSEISEIAGVSIATVSRVINQSYLVKEDTILKVYNAMNILDYDTSKFKEYRKESSEIASIILVIETNIDDNPFFGDIIKGIRTVAARYNHTVFLSHRDIINFTNINDLSKLLLSANISGLITLTSIDSKLLSQLASKFPLVQCCEVNNEVNTSSVAINDFESSKQVVNYLLSLGRRRIAFVNSDPRINEYAKYRLAGYRAELTDKGVPINDDWIIQLPEINFQMAESAIYSLIKRTDRPDAIFCVSDIYAAAAIKACSKAGISIPKDITIVGFDNLDISRMTTPTITTVNQPRFIIGLTACELLIEKIKNPNIASRQITPETELVIRESSTLLL